METDSLVSENTNASKPTTIPRRPYGSKLSNSNKFKNNLPSDLPIIGLGCSSFSTFFETNSKNKNPDDLSWVTQDHPDVKEWVKTITYAIQSCGINLLDTAPWYGHGSSEIVIGYAMQKLLHSQDADAKAQHKDYKATKDIESLHANQISTKKINRNDIVINTKVGRYESNAKYMFDFSAKRVHESVLLSIERMKCDYIDVLQLHDPEFAPSMDLLIHETIPELANMRKLGLVKAIGITGYPLHIQKQIIEQSWNVHKIRIDQSLTYGHYNLHDQSLFFPLTSKSDTKSKLDGSNPQITFADYVQNTHDMGLMCAAPLSMGLLTKKGPPSWHPASIALKNACMEASNLCNHPDTHTKHDNSQERVDIAKLAIAFALSQRRISCTLLGMKNTQEVDMAVSIAKLFADEDKEEDDVDLLQSILSPLEFHILQQILDIEKGPFVEVNQSGENEWDGEEEAEKFWHQVDGGKEEAEKTMRGSKT